MLTKGQQYTEGKSLIIIDSLASERRRTYPQQRKFTTVDFDNARRIDGSESAYLSSSLWLMTASKNFNFGLV